MLTADPRVIACRAGRSAVVRRGRRARVLRREGAASEHHSPRGRTEHPGSHPELVEAGRRRHARSPAQGRPPGTRLTGLAIEARRDGHRHHVDPHADGLRVPAAGVRGLRALPHGRRRGHDLRGERLGDRGRPPAPRRDRRSAVRNLPRCRSSGAWRCCARSATCLQRRARDRRAGRRRARRGAAPDDLAGGVAAEHHGRPAAGRSAARDAAAARGVLRAQEADEAADRRLRQDGTHGRGAGRRAGHRDRRPRRSRGATSGGRQMSRSTSRPPMRCWPTSRTTSQSAHASGHRHDRLVRRTSTSCVPRPRQAGLGVVASAEFLDRRQRVPARRGRSGAADAGRSRSTARGFTRSITRQARRPVGNGAAPCGMR